MIPREQLKPQDRVKAYLREVRAELRGPQLFLTRTAPEFLIELFKLEVPEVGQGLPDQLGGTGHRAERVAFGRVDVQDQMGRPVLVADQGQTRVVLDGPLVGKPQQRPPVVDQRVGDGPLRRVRPHPHCPDPLRGVPGKVLLHERVLPGPDPDHRQRAVAQHREDTVPHRIQVVHQVAFGGPGFAEERLVQVGQLYAVAFAVLAHRFSFAPIRSRGQGP